LAPRESSMISARKAPKELLVINSHAPGPLAYDQTIEAVSGGFTAGAAKIVINDLDASPAELTGAIVAEAIFCSALEQGKSLVVFGTRVLQGFSVMTASLHTQNVGKSEPRWRDSYHIEQQRLEAHHHCATPNGRWMDAPERDEIVDDERHDKNICGEE